MRYKVINNNIYDDWASDRTWSIWDTVTNIEVCNCGDEEIAQSLCGILNGTRAVMELINENHNNS